MNRDIQKIEAVLILENQAVELSKINQLTKIEINKIDSLIETLNKKYDSIESVFYIKKIASSYQITLRENYNEVIPEEYKVKKKKISKAFLETLAIIAYKQPITKAGINNIRGVNSNNHIKFLLEENFIKTAGKKNVLGKPTLYKTTSKFLENFDLSSLKDLPNIKEIKTYDFLEEK